MFGRWQDVLPQLAQYDGIFFDTYGEYYEDLRRVVLLALLSRWAYQSHEVPSPRTARLVPGNVQLGTVSAPPFLDDKPEALHGEEAPLSATIQAARHLEWSRECVR